MDSIDSFICAIANVRLPNVFNPYSDRCEDCDMADAASIRRMNLKSALVAAVTLNVRTVWIARDLGYRGGRRTGLALTDEAHLSDYSALLGGVPLQKSTHGPVMSERTSTVIWRMASRVGEPVFMWNVFPLHPHEQGRPLTNRCHTASERTALMWVLDAVMEIIGPERIYSIGRDAQYCLSSSDLSPIALRHPSYGGQAEFIRQIEAEYNLTTDTQSNSQQLPLL